VRTLRVAGGGVFQRLLEVFLAARAVPRGTNRI
jgi:hypothetical protein